MPEPRTSRAVGRDRDELADVARAAVAHAVELAEQLRDRPVAPSARSGPSGARAGRRAPRPRCPSPRRASSVAGADGTAVDAPSRARSRSTSRRLVGPAVGVEQLDRPARAAAARSSRSLCAFRERGPRFSRSHRDLEHVRRCRRRRDDERRGRLGRAATSITTLRRSPSCVDLQRDRRARACCSSASITGAGLPAGRQLDEQRARCAAGSARSPRYDDPQRPEREEREHGRDHRGRCSSRRRTPCRSRRRPRASRRSSARARRGPGG